MRLLTILLLSALSLQATGVKLNSKVLAIQVNRCPVTIFTNYHEENKQRKSSHWITDADFEETVRLLPNETGTITFFVIAQPPFTVNLFHDRSILRMNNTKIFVENQDQGLVFTTSFEVLQAVQESSIRLSIKDGMFEKITTIFVSTKSLEPPRPPTRYTSIFFGPSELANGTHGPRPGDEVIPAPVQITGTVGSLDTSATAANWSTVDEYFPTADEIINGRYANNTNKDLRLDSIVMNRESHHMSQRYHSKSNIYDIPVDNDENGIIKFSVSGKGKKSVIIRSIAGSKIVMKRAEIGSSGYAGFVYFVSDTRVEQDRVLLKIRNDRNDVLYFYLTMSRVN